MDHGNITGNGVKGLARDKTYLDDQDRFYDSVFRAHLMKKLIQHITLARRDSTNLTPLVLGSTGHRTGSRLTRLWTQQLYLVRLYCWHRDLQR